MKPFIQGLVISILPLPKQGTKSYLNSDAVRAERRVSQWTPERSQRDSAQFARLQAKAKVVRRHIINSTTAAGSGHPTSSLSATDVAVALYFAVMRYDAKNPASPARDKFILSKGHAAPLLYAVLAEAGFFSTDMLPTLRKIGSPLEGHPNLRRLPGVEASTDPLGRVCRSASARRWRPGWTRPTRASMS